MLVMELKFKKKKKPKQNKTKQKQKQKQNIKIKKRFIHPKNKQIHKLITLIKEVYTPTN